MTWLGKIPILVIEAGGPYLKRTKKATDHLRFQHLNLNKANSTPLKFNIVCVKT